MSRPPPVKHVLVLVDGTDTSSRAVDLAIDLARALRVRLTAMALVETETLRQLLSVQVLTEVEMVEFEGSLQESACRQLAEVRERALKRGLEIEDVIARGNSEVVVPKEVQARGADLIVLGFFEYNRAQRDLLARQRQQVLDHAPCPVLVAR
ncbi:MAG: universal stress protein [Kiritimatiellae bacterium]|nr:universal stress protein [Kiritimatiellia bacterium]